jgi:hypothetical protein
LLMVKSSVGQQEKCIHMTRSKQSEVPVVECRELRFVESFDDRYDCRIYEADIRALVSLAEFTNS